MTNFPMNFELKFP